MKGHLCIIMLFFGISQIAISQENIKKDSITTLDEVIVLEGVNTKHAEGITPSNIIGSTIFQNYSPLDIVSAMNQIPGVYVLSGALNTNRITIRGIGARTLFGTDKLRLYYNEIPITNGSGVSSIEAFDLESLYQIEVVKGPKSSTFGSVLGGAILLQPKEALGKSTNFSNNFTIGSYNLIKNNFSFSHNDDRLAIGLNYGHLETNGYRQNNRLERETLLLNTSFKINPKNKLGLLVNYVNFFGQIPSSLGITDFNENPQKAAFTWKAAKGFEANKYTLVGVSLVHDFSENFKNSTSIFYNYLDHYEPRPFGILDEFTNGFGFRSRFEGDFKLFEKTANYSYGAELYKDEYNWSEFKNLYQENNGNGSLQGELFSKNKEFRTQLNTFGNLLIHLSSKLEAQLGLNLNKTQYNYRDLFNDATINKSASRDFKTIILPNATINYTFGDSQMLFANISRGFSNPTLEETLTPDGVVNPDIAQETGVNYEIGANLYLNQKKLFITAAIYQMNIKNLLVSERINEDQFVGKNAGKTKHQGLELSTTYQIKISKSAKLKPFLNYTFNKHNFIDFVDEGISFSGNELTGVPKHQIQSGIQMELFQNFYWNTTHQFVGVIPLTDANSLYSQSFNLFTTKIGFQKKLNTHFSISSSFGVNNLFDVKYAQSVLINTQAFGSAEPRYYYPGNNRNYYGSLQISYSL